MKTALNKYLSFPYPPEYELPFKKQNVLFMFKPLVLIAAAVFCLVLTHILFIILQLEWLVPKEYSSMILIIHSVFLMFTAVTLCIVTIFRRQLFLNPNLFYRLCFIYCIVILVWSCLLAAYANFADLIFSTYIYVSLCVAFIGLLKPWQAIFLFMGNFILYILLLLFVWPVNELLYAKIINAGLAEVMSIAISISFYHYRCRTFYDNMTIRQQIEEIHSINDKLTVLTQIDQLTGLYNRRFLEVSLPGIMNSEIAKGKIAAGIMLDVDYFKDYNDRYGHQAGDICLRRIAEIVLGNVDLPTVYVVRYGGEEFFVLTFADKIAEFSQQAEKIRSSVENAFIEHLSHPLGKVTVSIGLAVHRSAEDPDLNQLIQLADKALYRAKMQGRNQVVLPEAKDSDGPLC